MHRTHVATWAQRVVHLGALLLVACLLAPATAARADRFGLPSQGRVTVDMAIVYSEPDPHSPVVGPLGKESHLALLGQSRDADGGLWTATQLGYVQADQVTEDPQPWVAEVRVPSVAVYAKPFHDGGVRRIAEQGDLLRVMGVSPGLEGDTTIWWATTEGYVALDTLQETAGEAARQWSLPTSDEAPNGWWGQLSSQGHVHTGPSLQAPIVGSLPGGSRVKVLSEEQGEEVDGSALWYRIDGGRFAGGRIHSSLVERIPAPQLNTTALPDDEQADSWIVVDRSASTLTLVHNGQAQFVTFVSLGKAGKSTPAGRYWTAGKFPFDRMTSETVPEADHAYDLPNVPFTQYFRSDGSAIHATYWHDEFGAPESQGCVNVSWADGAYLFAQTRPTIAYGMAGGWVPAEDATPLLIVD